VAQPTRGTNATQRRRADQASSRGLALYQDWQIDAAIEELKAAIQAEPGNPDHYLDLTRALARNGEFDSALRSLADFLRLEPDSPLTERFERLFAKGLDAVEAALTETMKAQDVPLDEIGAAIHMWFEYRIAIGRTPLNLRNPRGWAAALDYTVRKVNLREAALDELAARYGVSQATVRRHHEELVDALDIMPCDYRYFCGGENPLDKLVEAATLMEQLEARFREL
jgi:tetratricopeptide (TPR) repeat protein